MTTTTLPAYQPDVIPGDPMSLPVFLRKQLNAIAQTLGNVGGVFRPSMVVIPLASLPTADPHAAGQIWRNGTTLMISTG